MSVSHVRDVWFLYESMEGGSGNYTSISLRASVLATAMVGEVVLCDCDFWYTDDRCWRWMLCGGAGDGVCRAHSSLHKYFPPRRAAGFCNNNKSSLQHDATYCRIAAFSRSTLSPTSQRLVSFKGRGEPVSQYTVG